MNPSEVLETQGNSERKRGWRIAGDDIHRAEGGFYEGSGLKFQRKPDQAVTALLPLGGKGASE
jgi:hypothetical protein